MKCPACGLENENDAKFCISCGKAISPALMEPAQMADQPGTSNDIASKIFSSFMATKTKFETLPAWTPWALIVMALFIPITISFLVPTEAEIRKNIAGKWYCDKEYTINGKTDKSTEEIEFFPNGAFDPHDEPNDAVRGAWTHSYSISGNNITKTEHFVGMVYVITWNYMDSTRRWSGEITKINSTHLKYKITKFHSDNSVVPSAPSSTAYNCARK